MKCPHCKETIECVQQHFAVIDDVFIDKDGIETGRNEGHREFVETLCPHCEENIDEFIEA